MSTVNYARIAANATRTLQRYGQSWTFTATTSANTSSSRTCIGVKIDEVKVDLMDSNLQIGDHRMIFTGTTNPVRGERISAGSTALVIVHTEAIQPAATVVAWWVWARGG